MRRLFNKKAQNTADYVITIGLVIAAVVSMQTLIRRGILGKVKIVVDNLGAATGEDSRQYEPYYRRSNMSSTTDAREILEFHDPGGQTVRRMGEGGGTPVNTTRTGLTEATGWDMAD